MPYIFHYIGAGRPAGPDPRSQWETSPGPTLRQRWFLDQYPRDRPLVECSGSNQPGEIRREQNHQSRPWVHSLHGR